MKVHAAIVGVASCSGKVESKGMWCLKGFLGRFFGGWGSDVGGI